MTAPIILSLLLLSSGEVSPSLAPGAGHAPDPLHAACATGPGEEPALPGITVSDEPAAEYGSKALRVRNEANGGYLLVFYEDGTEATARAQAACLGAQIALVAAQVSDRRNGAQWWSVAFTQDPDHPRMSGAGEMPRWPVLVQPDGQLGPNGSSMVTFVMPHEQVHAYQSRVASRLPRWLAEGHARWVQRSLEDRFDPAVTARQERGRADKAAESEGPLKLSTWGNERVKREAFFRQISADEQARMEADPNYWPTGVFTFKEGDFEKDVVANEDARYAASLAVVQGLAERHGRPAVNAWITELTAGERGQISDEMVDASLRSHFGETLEHLLGNAR